MFATNHRWIGLSQRPDARNCAVRAGLCVSGGFYLEISMSTKSRKNFKPYKHPAGGWRFAAFRWQKPHARRRSPQGLSCIASPEQAERVRVCELSLGQAGAPSSVRILRGRRQGNDLGRRLTHPLRYDAVRSQPQMGRARDRLRSRPLRNGGVRPGLRERQGSHHR
jgi:hypothetical protein